MAKAIGPAHSTEVHGKIGDLVFNAWRGIHTIKIRKNPTQPRTARQLFIRSYMTTCVRAWASLSAANQAAWIAYAAAHLKTDWTNVAVRVTGANWYCALSVRLLDMSKSVVASPPTVSAPAGIAGAVATGGSGQVSIAFTAHGGTAETIDAWLTAPISLGKIPKITMARHHVYAPAETTPLVITGLAAGHYAAFLRCVSETDGQVSTWVSVTFTVT
jgi:hypothetical protein